MLPLMRTLVVALAVALTPGAAAAQRARSPADATVFIRLIGSVHPEFEELGIKRTADVERVEIGTGSGFVISPYGYVLTNAHVVESGEPFRITKGLQRATVTLKVSSVNVCFSGEAMAARGMSAPCAEASITASDPNLDLAVLFIAGSSNLPYVALGDSDVVAAGLTVDALGYPFGREVEVGRVATAPDLMPDVSTTPGAISALRTNDAGERRYLRRRESRTARRLCGAGTWGREARRPLRRIRGGHGVQRERVARLSGHAPGTTIRARGASAGREGGVGRVR